jgi:hypothetical protein
MSNDSKISLLQGKDNYAIWRINIRAILRSKNYWNSTLSNGDAEVTAAATIQLQQAEQPMQPRQQHQQQLHQT